MDKTICPLKQVNVVIITGTGEAHKRRLAWNVLSLKYGDSYSFSGMQDVCTREEEVCIELEPGVEECMIDCVEMTTFIFRLYDATFEAGVEIALPEDCDEKCYERLFNEGMASGATQLQEHEENRNRWTQTDSIFHQEFCFTETINAGGSCYGCDGFIGCACHSFGWDGCALVEFTIAKPTDIYFPKMPKGVKFLYRGTVMTRNWDEKIYDKMDTPDMLPFFGLKPSDCYRHTVAVMCRKFFTEY